MTKKELDKHLKLIESKINKLNSTTDNNKKYFDIEKKILEDKLDISSSSSESESEDELMNKIKMMKQGLKKYMGE